LSLRVTDETRALVARHGYDEDHGARLLARVFQQQVTTAVSRCVLTAGPVRGDLVVVDVVAGHVVAIVNWAGAEE
jgi:ATP-dependent Clp protease ATP-binding subunit ClpA